MDIIIIVGTGRCGTVTVARQMYNLDALSLHEGVPVNPRLSTRHRLQHLTQGDPNSNWNVESVRRRVFLMNRYRSGFFAEAAHYYAHNLHLVERFMPTARLIHLVRPALETVNSYILRTRQPIYGTNGAHPVSAGVWKGWCDSFPIFKEPKNQAEGFALHWQRANEAIERSKLPRLVVGTNALKDRETWDEVTKWIGVDRRIYNHELVLNHRNKSQIKDPTDEMIKACEKFCTWKPNTSMKSFDKQSLVPAKNKKAIDEI